MRPKRAQLFSGLGVVNTMVPPLLFLPATHKPKLH